MRDGALPWRSQPGVERRAGARGSRLRPDHADRGGSPLRRRSLLGLVRHLADVERRWFRRVLAGQNAPALFSSTADPDEDFHGATDAPTGVAAAWAAWRTEVAFAERFVAEAPDLDVEGDDSWRGTVSLRWVLLHMIEEYARHNGHADLLRERIDGAIGL
ncbi:DinB family protein [Streptomyces paradoxus]|uniref:DinB family protein n=1 Tax=Streptomyces paradoxus TaxID=66375 RepID=UPI003645B120